MPNAKHITLADRVAAVLADVVAIDVEELERLMQAAHECEPAQLDDPPQRFGISRQALRMLWHFRCNLESVEVTTTGRE